MSGNDMPSQPARDSRVNDVGFSSVADRYGEASRGLDSRSSGKRSDKSSTRHRKTNLDVPSQDRDGSSAGNFAHKAQKRGGFLLNHMFSNDSSQAGTRTRNNRNTSNDNHVQVGKTRSSHGRHSAGSSMASSPLPREIGHDGSAKQEKTRESSTRSTSQSVDPAQLVQMALNLSEGRKRPMNNTLSVPLPTNHRASTGPVSNYETVKRATTSRQPKARPSDNWSRNSASPNHSRPTTSDLPEDEVAPPRGMEDNIFYTFSPATLSRAEKARKYFELASEHRRLLQSLPPLKPDAEAPGNWTYESTSASGFTMPHISRVQSSSEHQHPLGRQYNPIQALRDRRVRIRERRPFTASPETWQDLEAVKSWVNEVQGSAEDYKYRPVGDKVYLPRFAGDTSGGRTGQDFSARRRRADTAGSVITRPENSWTIEPTELLADTYWTEQDDNKAMIETRRGNPVFPYHKRQGVDAPKISVEMHRGEEEIIEAKSDHGSSDEGDGGMSRRRKIMLPLKRDKGKHRRLNSRSPSTKSVSSDDGGRPRRPRRTDTEENLGPLERHMRDLIAKEANEEPTSPISPDHWDTTRTRFQTRSSIDRTKRGSISRSTARDSLEVPSYRRSRSADGRVDSIDSTMRSTSHDDSGSISPADKGPGNGGGERDSLNISRLLNLRSLSKERNNIGHTDFAPGSKAEPYTIASIRSGHERPRSVESKRPPTRRHKTSSSISSGILRSDTNSTAGTAGSFKEPGSTVGRFFKGRWVGDLVRSENSRFGDRFKGRDKLAQTDNTDPSMSDSDGDIDPERLNNKYHDPSEETRSEGRPSMDIEGGKSKYHLGNLPAFTSASRDNKRDGETPKPVHTDPISRQLKAQRDAGQSERFKTLAPPKITVSTDDVRNLRDIVPDDVSEEAIEETADPIDLRQNLMFAPNDSRSSLNNHRGSAYNPTGRRDQRHWSISDHTPAPTTTTTHITFRDLAHARALLLSSGIKAREIHRRALAPADPPPQFLTFAATTANQPVPTSTPARDTPQVAAQLLSSHLESKHAAVDASFSSFQTSAAKSLSQEIEALTTRAATHLTTLALDTSDAADAFIAELTTGHPQQAKQVDDAVDAMWRRRRRQFRLLKRVGFKLLEWVTLSIMWGIWAVVVLLNWVRRILMGSFRVVRWLVVP